MNRREKSTVTRKQQPSIAKRRGEGPKDIHVSTKKPKKPQVQHTEPPIVDPPQAKMLAQEYVHNLEQQIYFLDAEIRFLRDRSGTDDRPDDTSVDAAIRRLRRAIAMHEEETNRKIETLQGDIQKRRIDTENIDLSIATDKLENANVQEMEKDNTLKETYIETARKIHMNQLVHSHYNNVANFIEVTKDSLLQTLEESKARRTQQEEDLKQIENKLEELRDGRKSTMAKFYESIHNKRMSEEVSDLLTIIGNEEEKPPPNLPLTQIKSKNAKIEREIEAAIASQNEIQEQIDQLMEKNVRLKAELNQITAKVERAQAIKSKMEKQFGPKLLETKSTNEKQVNEIANLKKTRKEVKAKLAESNGLISLYSQQINQLKNEQALLQNVTYFKREQKAKIIELNETTQEEIQSLEEDIKLMQMQLDELSNMVANSAEKQKKAETLVRINLQDERCQMEKLPPELAQLYESLTAVNVAMAEK